MLAQATVTRAWVSDSECDADSVPSVLQPRSMPPQLEQLPDVAPSSGGYSLVLFHWAIITVTRRSLRLAVSLASLTFTALQARACSGASYLDGNPAEQCCWQAGS